MVSSGERARPPHVRHGSGEIQLEVDLLRVGGVIPAKLARSLWPGCVASLHLPGRADKVKSTDVISSTLLWFLPCSRRRKSAYLSIEADLLPYREIRNHVSVCAASTVRAGVKAMDKGQATCAASARPSARQDTSYEQIRNAGHLRSSSHAHIAITEGRQPMTAR